MCGEVHRFESRHGVTVAWDERGRGDLAIVLVHGAMMSRRAWRPFAEAMLSQTGGVRIVTLDLPGFGQSSKPEAGYDFPTQAAMLARFLRHAATRPAARTVLVGHSMGGAIALHLALDYPGIIDGLVVMDSALGKPQGGGSIVNLVRQIAGKEGDDAAPGREFLSGYVRNWLFAPDTAKVEALVEDAMLMTEASFRGVRMAVAAHDLSSRIAGFPRLPLLALRGAHDRTRTAGEMRAMAALTPVFRFAQIDAAGHCPQVERPAATAAAVVQWLAERDWLSTAEE